MNCTRITVFGNQESYRLGNRERRDDTTKPFSIPHMDSRVRAIRQRQNCLLILTAEGNVYRAGCKNNWEDRYPEIDKVPDRLLPSEPIIDLRAGLKAGLLTDNDKLYVGKAEGSGRGLFGDNREWKFHYTSRPNETEEKILHWEMGYDNLVYTTANGKAYYKSKCCFIIWTLYKVPTLIDTYN